MSIHVRMAALLASLLLLVTMLAASPARATARGRQVATAPLAAAAQALQGRSANGRIRVAPGNVRTRHYAGRHGRHYAGRHGRHYSRRILDAPFYYITTPSHRQVNNYYCGPATCQIIDDYWHSCQPQQAYAAYGGMCPGHGGTIFSRLDETLRHFTGKSYGYHAGIASAGDLFSRIEEGLFTKHYPEAVLVHIDPAAYDWSPYRLPHAGHIVCLEAFDWRRQSDGNMIVRINDPYAENATPPLGHGSSGGSTYGHHVYHRQLVWYGVSGTSQRALVY